MGKTWDLHLEKVVRVDRDENLAMIADSVAFLAAQGEVVYDAEHFFDGSAQPRLRPRDLRAAADAGAAWVVLCDTNGGSLPEEVARRRAVRAGPMAVPIGIHTHNDGDLAVANTLAAVAAGRDAGAGDDQRHRRAVRQRRPLQRGGQPLLKLGYEVLRPGSSPT